MSTADSQVNLKGRKISKQYNIQTKMDLYNFFRKRFLIVAHPKKECSKMSQLPCTH